jgi:hypothetical protein
MPARIWLVGGLKPPQKNKSSKNEVIMPFLGNFVVHFLYLLWAVAHFPIILDIYSVILFLYSFCRFLSKFHAPRMALAYNNVGQKEFFITFIL